MNRNYKNILPISGAQHTLDGPQSGRGGAKFGVCCAPRGRAQHKLGELKFPPVNQPQRNAFSVTYITDKGFIPGPTSNSINSTLQVWDKIQQQSGKLKFPPVNQPRCNAFSEQYEESLGLKQRITKLYEESLNPRMTMVYKKHK